MSCNEPLSATAQEAFSTRPTKTDPYRYQVGFGNRFASEAIPGTLPQGQNNPQKAKYGLYTEQLNGTPFVTARAQNQHAWLYRIRPAVENDGFTALPKLPDLEHNFLTINPNISVSAAELLWDPIPMPTEPTEFIEGLKTMAGAGDSSLREGLAIHVYAANTSMRKRAFVNTDGDMLVVPVEGRLDIQTEFGKLMVHVGEIVVIQRGMRFKVSLPDGPSRGYIQELFGAHYELPELGPLGANGLANPRDFESPVASFEIDQGAWQIVYKLSGTLHLMKQNHTPFDVVAWHGNYVPYKYDLKKFVRIGSVSHDHLDPSVFCVLTSRSKSPGTSLSDFIVFAPRWDVSKDTFRPPYFHRNTAAEFVGKIYGPNTVPGNKFPPGAINYNNTFTPHGVTKEMYDSASKVALEPMWISEDTCVFMFESSMPLSMTAFAMGKAAKQPTAACDPKMVREGYHGEFLDHLDEVNKELCSLGLPTLSKA